MQPFQGGFLHTNTHTLHRAIVSIDSIKNESMYPHHRHFRLKQIHIISTEKTHTRSSLAKWCNGSFKSHSVLMKLCLSLQSSRINLSIISLFFGWRNSCNEKQERVKPIWRNHEISLIVYDGNFWTHFDPNTDSIYIKNLFREMTWIINKENKW